MQRITSGASKLSSNITYEQKELLKGIADGNAAAFKSLYDQYGQRAYYTAFKLLRSPVAAQDAVQEIFIKVWVNREELRDMDHFPAWLGAVIRNHIYYKLRQQTRDAQYLHMVLDEEHTGWQDKEYSEAELQELLGLIRTGIDRLSPQQRRVIELSRLKGLKHREIAAEMNLSQETVKKYIMDAMRALRQFLTEHGRDISVIVLLQLLQL